MFRNCKGILKAITCLGILMSISIYIAFNLRNIQENWFLFESSASGCHDYNALLIKLGELELS